MQKIFVMGFVGRDVEERFTSGGKKVNSFPVGINFNKGGEKITVWYRINCWEEVASKILPYIKKGSLVTVVGDLNPPTTYQSKNGDIKIDMTITCDSISFVPSPKPKEDKKKDESVFDFGGV